MCGIVGVTGSDRAADLVLTGLSRLEYRGYDSAGIALVCEARRTNGTSRDGARPSRDGDPPEVVLFRARRAQGTGSVAALAASTDLSTSVARAGIGHTRWATHGRPGEGNAHPHLDCTGSIAIVHNGIIENHAELAAELAVEGHRLVSETDSEVIAHLVEQAMRGGADLASAVRWAVSRLAGTFALVALSTAEPAKLVAARRVSPLIVGIADGVGLVASDIPAILGEASSFYSLEDDQVVEVTPGALSATGFDGLPVPELRPVAVAWDLSEAEKGGYPDFMSKEIREQPQAVADTLRERLSKEGRVLLDEERLAPSALREIDKVFIVACGSSFHAGLVAKYAIEHWARLPVEIDIASEFRYRDPVLDSRTLVVGVSQSGETIDTYEAMRAGGAQGARTLAVCNVVDSSMARDADAVLYTRAGPEIGVAATKTFVAQVAALQVLALFLAQERGAIYPEESAELIEALRFMPDRVAETLQRDRLVDELAASLVGAKDFLYIGRHVGFPVALEGALKLKEISYLRAEGYPAGELKHGPIALVEEGVVVVAVATRGHLSSKMLANVEEVRSRGATVVALATDGDEEVAARADHVLWVPPVSHSLFSPMVDVVPLQLLAYSLAVLRGNDVDRPRNLAKTVTVE